MIVNISRRKPIPVYTKLQTSADVNQIAGLQTFHEVNINGLFIQHSSNANIYDAKTILSLYNIDCLQTFHDVKTICLYDAV